MANFRKYRPALAAFLCMMAMALTTTGLSFFVGPVCAELGLGRGAFTAYYSVMTFAGTVAAPFLGQFIQRRGVGLVAAVSGIWAAVGLFGFSLCGELWQFYLMGGMTGLFGTACVTLCAGVIVQTLYHGSAAARLTGVVMAGSGFGGALVSMILPGLIENFGWRWGYRLSAAGWMILLLFAAVLLRGTTGRTGEIQPTAETDGMTRKEALRNGRLYLLIALMFLLSAASGVQQQLPSVLEGAGLDAANVSGAMSLFTAALALGKIGQGMVYGKIGPVKGGSLMIVLYALGFGLLGRSMVWPGLLTLAVGMGTVTTLMPIVTRTVFGSREYAAIWSILSAVSNLGALTAVPLFGVAFDATGSYSGAVTATAILLIPAVVVMLLAFRSE